MVIAKILYVNEAYFGKYYEESARMKIETLMRVLQENMSFRIPKECKMAKLTVCEKEKAVMKKSATEHCSFKLKWPRRDFTNNWPYLLISLKRGY